MSNPLAIAHKTYLDIPASLRAHMGAMAKAQLRGVALVAQSPSDREAHAKVSARLDAWVQGTLPVRVPVRHDITVTDGVPLKEELI